MPSTFSTIDTGFPAFTGGESTEQKVDALYSYVFLLLENLRYILRNLGPENFNQQDMKDIFDELEANVIISNTVITNELYAEFGAIADLVVDELRTDYQRAYRYQIRYDNPELSLSPIDYIHIYDEEINFITASVITSGGTPQTEQLHHGDRYFWWRDETMSQMTSMEETDWPVIVWKYSEMTKGTFRFDEVLSGGTTTKIPQIILGAGYGNQSYPDRGKGIIRKNTDSFDLWMETSGGIKNGIFVGDSYTDIVGLRKTTEIDFSNWDNGYFSEIVDGARTNSYTVTFDANDRPVKITDAANHETVVIWE